MCLSRRFRVRNPGHQVINVACQEHQVVLHGLNHSTPLGKLSERHLSGSVHNGVETRL